MALCEVTATSSLLLLPFPLFSFNHLILKAILSVTPRRRQGRFLRRRAVNRPNVARPVLKNIYGAKEKKRSKLHPADPPILFRFMDLLS